MYVKDPDKYTTVPEIMVKVDFLFWTGERFIAVEIDGDGKRLGDVVSRDRKLKKIGIEVIHVLNSDITSGKAWNLLPEEITQFWKSWKPQFQGDELGYDFQRLYPLPTPQRAAELRAETEMIRKARLEQAILDMDTKNSPPKPPDIRTLRIPPPPKLPSKPGQDELPF